MNHARTVISIKTQIWQINISNKKATGKFSSMFYSIESYIKSVELFGLSKSTQNEVSV